MHHAFCSFLEPCTKHISVSTRRGSPLGRNRPLWIYLFQKSPRNKACWRFWLCLDNTSWIRMSESNGVEDLIQCQQRRIVKISASSHQRLDRTLWTSTCHLPVRLKGDTNGTRRDNENSEEFDSICYYTRSLDHSCLIEKHQSKGVITQIQWREP